MSGIVGILNLDGADVEPELLQHLTNFMHYRGCDAQKIWHSGTVGLGHALLRTSDDFPPDYQPFTLDGQVWITADARIDGRSDLRSKLGLPPSQPSSDGELILLAYLRWQTDCVQYLLGDFAFAIWDSREQSLFCARDRLGIKQFYYAFVGKCFVFSNTIDCLLQHPLVPQELNEQAIGDFLLFEQNYEPQTTIFAAIQQLQAAHTLTVSTNKLQPQQRYWHLAIPKVLRYSKDSDYIEHFHTLISTAVEDRLRTDKAAILFSGGLDSTTIAATAVELRNKKNQPLDIQGFTVIYEHLIPDQERYYAQLASQALGIPVNYFPADHYQLYQGWERQAPEPTIEPLAIIDSEHLRKISQHSRVILNGQGADEALYTATLAQMWSGMNTGDVITGLCHSLVQHRLLPPLGLGIKSRLKSWFRTKTKQDYYPDWLNGDFAHRLQLRERWHYIQNMQPESVHPFRPQAYQDIISPRWQPFLAAYDPGFSRLPVEVRFPFLDLRLLNYLLALPPLPWCVDKQLLRVAMQGKLPPEIRLRPKTPVQGDPILKRIHQGEQPWRQLEQMSELNAYVDVQRILATISHQPLNSWTAWELMRPLSLGYWLQQEFRLSDRKR